MRRRRKPLAAAVNKPVKKQATTPPPLCKKRAISDETRYFMENIIKMRAQGESFNDIAKGLNISTDVARRLHEQACRYVPNLTVTEYREKMNAQLDWAIEQSKQIAQTFIPRVTVTGGVVVVPELDNEGNKLESIDDKILRDYELWLKSLKEYTKIIAQKAKLNGVELPVSNVNANNNTFDFRQIKNKEEFAEMVAEMAMQRDLQGNSALSASILQALILAAKIRGFIDAQESEQILAKYIVLPPRDESLDGWKTKEIDSSEVHTNRLTD